MATSEGKKTGGRKKGTLNVKTAELHARLSSLGLDPIQGLSETIKELDPEQQAHIYLGLMPYLYPKRKAIEISPEDSERLNQIRILEKASPEYLKSLIHQAIQTGSKEIDLS